MREKLLRIPIGEVPVSRQETVKQVQALARRGLKEIMSRFDEVDVRLDDILAMLRDLPTAVAWLRRQRDWFFRTNHAWGAVFADWVSAPSHFDEFLLKVIERTYVFLAPRFMSFQEWTIRKPAEQEKLRAVMVMNGDWDGLGLSIVVRRMRTGVTRIFNRVRSGF